LLEVWSKGVEVRAWTSNLSINFPKSRDMTPEFQSDPRDNQTRPRYTGSKIVEF